MRFLKKNAVMLLLLSVPVLICSSSAFGAGRGAFIDWASDESREIDTRWETITGGNRLEPVELSGGNYRRARPGTGTASARYVSGSGFIRTVATGNIGSRLFPRTSRERSGPTRGNFSFSSPASMNHGLSNQFRRPRGSSAYRWNSCSRRGTVSRPRLEGFGRISRSSRRSTVGTNISPFSGRIRRRR
ncbi:MAG: hypothetical protein GF417_07075 [Candidatus Latescibacteria bacterium]|nr:hypothetical protein [bacterium]MBD3424181.1 hypothetical protein [Candidatus Latescibacterota bacterium]